MTDAIKPSADPIDGLPKCFTVKSDGIYLKADNADKPDLWISSEIVVLARIRDSHNTGWGLLIEVTDHDGHKHQSPISASLLAGDGTELRAHLLQLGARLAQDPNSRRAFIRLLAAWSPTARVLKANRLGWVDDACTAFLCGNGEAIGESHIVVQNNEASAETTDMVQQGTLADWKATVASQCIDNPLLLFAVSLAFAGVILEPLRYDGGGVHLRGQSSSGKSTVLRVSASVWGSPRFVQSWRATANGLEGIAVSRNSTLLPLDELGEISGHEAGNAVYMLSNGKGKSRASRSGSPQPSLRWKTMILSSGEITLADKIAEAGGRPAAGQDIRLLDIVADCRAFGAFDHLHGAPDGSSFSKLLSAATSANYGTAGPEFVRRLLADADIETQLRGVITGFQKEVRLRLNPKCDGQTDRAAAQFALIAAAGEYATTQGLTGWEPGAARQAAIDLFAAWLDRRGGALPAEARAARERVRAYLLRNRRAIMAIENAGTKLTGSSDVGWYCDQVFYLPSKVWQTIHDGQDPSGSARYRKQAGILERADGDNLQVRLPSRLEPERPRAYAIHRRILDEC